MKQTVIQLSDVHFRYPDQDKDLLNIADFQIYQGGHLLIHGASGSGKTTLLNIITGISQPSSGTVQVLDKSLQNLSNTQRDQFRVDYLGIIFQQFNLLPYLSLLENVKLPCWFSKKRQRVVTNTQQTAERLLEELSLSPTLFNKPVNTLSTGQQQRVAVARALIGAPKIIIADEPTSSLDEGNRQRFLQLLFQQADKQQSTVVFVSHDTTIAKYFSRVIELSEINQAVEGDSTTHFDSKESK
ncbi:MAG TPA: ABC transporter ATP-binding protein [Leucothrix mucor]|nr:ABC transporter ATP-binding protein [Leucothrix mucor]